MKVELIDLRCLNPFDWEAIAASVGKTNRALVAYEDTLSWGYGAEIAARIADQLFDQLDAPVRRVAAADTFVAYQPILEDAILAPGERSVPGDEGIGGVLELDGGRVPPVCSSHTARVRERDNRKSDCRA